MSLEFPIQKDYILADVVEQWPVTAMVMLRYGLSCVGCQVAAVDSVEEGAASHGMDESTIAKMMDEMNKAVKLVEAKKALENKRPGVVAAASTSTPTAGTTAAVEGDSCACGNHGTKAGDAGHECKCGGTGACGCGAQGGSDEGHEHGKEHAHKKGDTQASGESCCGGGSCGC